MSLEIVSDQADRIRQVAEADYVDPLLMGPTGTGKSRTALMIKEFSPRSGKPFVEVNCAEIPASLIESELFGYEKGTFTGATAHKKGKFEAAHTGTLFLDEIGELPPELQAKLLKVVEEKKITRIGGITSIPVDVRLIYATHQDLSVFREDFLYQISSYVIHLKPLRERQGEIPPLAHKFIVNFNERAKSDLYCADEALECLKTPLWSGNIRQLRDFVQRVCLECLMRAENKAATVELFADDFQQTLAKEGLLIKKPEKNPVPAAKPIALRVDSCPYWETLQINAVKSADREFLARYHELAVQGKTTDEIGNALGIKRSTLFYRLKRIKTVIAGEEHLMLKDEKKHWFYYWSRRLQHQNNTVLS